MIYWHYRLFTRIDLIIAVCLMFLIIWSKCTWFHKHKFKYFNYKSGTTYWKVVAVVSPNEWTCSLEQVVNFWIEFLKNFFCCRSSSPGKKSQAKVPKRIHKAERERMKREHLNDLFLDLANALGNILCRYLKSWSCYSILKILLEEDVARKDIIVFFKFPYLICSFVSWLGVVLNRSKSAKQWKGVHIVWSHQASKRPALSDWVP